MTPPPNFLVLTLHSGENEIDKCRGSIKAQVGVQTTHVIFSDLDDAEAHRTLYNEIMARAEDFDLFLKLDADMVLNRDDALKGVADYFQSSDDVDLLTTEVNDHFTGRRIIGVHVFSPRVRWDTRTHDALFVDPRPLYPGQRSLAPAEVPVFVEHAPAPGGYQAFHFGYHRALKALQPGRLKRKLDPMTVQLGVLEDLKAHALATRRRELGLAVIAAHQVFSGQFPSLKSGNKNEPLLKQEFETLNALGEADVFARVAQIDYKTWRLRLAHGLARTHHAFRTLRSRLRRRKRR